MTNSSWQVGLLIHAGRKVRWRAIRTEPRPITAASSKAARLPHQRLAAGSSRTIERLAALAGLGGHQSRARPGPANYGHPADPRLAEVRHS